MKKVLISSKIITAIFIIFTVLASCGKGFLDKKPDQSLLVPSSIENFQGLLDNVALMNDAPALHLLAADDYGISDNGLKAFSQPMERNSYIWAHDLYESTGKVVDWSVPYEQVFYTNIVLDGLNGLIGKEGVDLKELNKLKGTALFFRSWAFFQLTQLFTAPYNAATAATTHGLPMPLSSDVNERPGRNDLEKFYQQIIHDLVEAEMILPDNAIVKSRPDRQSALALLARIYLTMENYPKALFYADACLKQSDLLIDYNSLLPSATRPFPKSLPNGNDEVLFYTVAYNYSFFGSKAALTTINDDLYNSYTTSDLRSALFFNNKPTGITFKGNYTGNVGVFTGLATDEMYLIRAECYARMSKVLEAMADLNALSVKRYDKASFIPFTASSELEALTKILTERRKELVARGTRWTDLRRLNRDPRFAVVLKKTFDGKEYSLAPNDPKYVFPIPDAELHNNSIAQNPR